MSPVLIRQKSREQDETLCREHMTGHTGLFSIKLGGSALLAKTQNVLLYVMYWSFHESSLGCQTVWLYWELKEQVLSVSCPAALYVGFLFLPNEHCDSLNSLFPFLFSPSRQESNLKCASGSWTEICTVYTLYLLIIQSTNIYWAYTMYQEILFTSSRATVKKETKTGPCGTYIPVEERHIINKTQDGRC